MLANGGSGAGMGGAVFNMQGTLDVRDSTLTANAAHGGTDASAVTDDGKGMGGAVFNLSGTFTAEGSTFAANTADSDGGSIYNLVYDAHTARTAQTTLHNTIVANDLSPTDLASNKTAYISPSPVGTADASVGDFNFVTVAAAREQGSVTGTALTGDPLLDPAGLRDNGGLTQTIALQPGSPAIDAGHAATGESADQRGAPRPADLPGVANATGGDGSDIGAFEVQPAPETTIDTGPTDGTILNSSPTYGFSSNVPGSTFACSVHFGGAFSSCSSPMTVGSLADGSHTFAARLTDPWHGPDGAPVQRGFTLDTAAPNTTIGKHPKRKLRLKRHKKRVKVKFAFASSEAGSTFTCKVDKKRLAACTSPLVLKVKKGKHRLSVIATDYASNADPSAATFGFKVKPAKRRHHRHHH